MLVEIDRQLQLGTDAVSTRDQHGLFVTLWKFEQAAEAAEAAHYAWAVGAGDAGLDFFDEFVAGIDIHPGITVT